MGTMDAMGAWQLLLVGLVMLFGLLGSVLPGLPGPLLIWAAVLWWSMSERGPDAWWLLVGSTLLLLANQALQLLIRNRPHHRTDVRRRSLITAGAAGIVGFFVIPVAGVVPGFLAGLYCRERGRLGRHGAAVASTRTVMRATGWKVLSELSACLLVAGAWTGLLLWG